MKVLAPLGSKEVERRAMQSCDDFQIAIEQRLHGVPGVAEGPLEAHLASCAQCRAYQDSARQAETTMNASAEAALRQVDWKKVERGVRSQFAQMVYAFGFAFLALIAMNAILYWLIGPEGMQPRDLLNTLLPELAIPGSIAVWAVFRTRRILRLKTQEETLTWLRHNLDLAIRDLRLARWVFLVISAIGPLVLLFTAGMDTRRRVALAAIMLIPLAGLALVQWVKLPRALRDRAELDSDGPS